MGGDELVKPFTPVPAQQIMIDHLRQHLNVLGFVGVGVGKTAACLYHLNELFLNAEATSALVLAPLRVCNLTWPLEIKTWGNFKWMRCANLRTESGQRDFLQGRAHIYVLNYEAINTLVSLVERRGGTIPYDVVIFDELTKAKNPSSKRINLYRRKVPRATRQWGITGTPVPNSHLDLFAQVRLVDNGERLGNNFLQFKRDLFYSNGNPFAPWKEKKGTAKLIEEKLSDITVTLRSADWLDIPEPIFEDVEIEFTPELRERYELLEEELVIELHKDKVINVANAAALVTKLLQFTSGKMYDDEGDTHPIHNLKFDELKKIAKKEGPLLVPYIFKHEAARIRQAFPQARFFSDCKRSSAEKTIKEELKLIDEWNTGSIPILAGHPQGTSHGLNLQYGSNAMVWTTLTYSREGFEQMVARLVRRGQKDPVKVYRLMVKGTVDEAVASALESKAENEARLISALQMLESYRTQGGQK